MLWEHQGKGRLSHRRCGVSRWGLQRGLNTWATQGSRYHGSSVGPLPSKSSQNQELHKETETLQGRRQKLSHPLCIWLGVRLSVYPATESPLPPLPVVGPAPVCTCTYRCVRHAGRWHFQSFPSLQAKSAGQFLVAAQTRSRERRGKLWPFLAWG